MSRMTMTDLLATNRLNGLKLRRNGDEGPVYAQLATAETIEANFVASLAKIQRDDLLTLKGRQEAARELGRKTLDALKAWHAPLAEAGATAQRNIRGTMREAVRPRPAADIGERIEAALAAAEFRRVASGLDDLATDLLYRNGGPAVRAALDSAPRVTIAPSGLPHVAPFVSEALRAEVLDREAAEVSPDLADILYNATAIAGIYAQAAGVVESAVRAAGVAPPAPVTVVS